MTSILSKLAPFSLYGLCALAAAVPLSGCKSKPYPQCKKDKDCKAELGEKCVDGMCQSCTVDDDCKGKGPDGADWVCRDLRCAAPDCQTNADCGDKACVNHECVSCTEDAQCAPGTCDLGTGTCVAMSTEGPPCGGKCKPDEVCENDMCVAPRVESGGNPCGLDAVYFEFDSPTLTSTTRTQLKGVAECFKTQGRLVYLEAHADQRGTEEYNIMLTDKRGNAVRKYLSDLGVSGDKMQVVSKGDLEATGTDEASMAKDRRVQFIWPQ